MRSIDIKVRRTDGSTDTSQAGRSEAVRAAIQTVTTLAEKVVLVHDHKGHLYLFHLGTLDKDERAFVRQLWVMNGEPAVNVTFVDLGAGDGREIL